MAYLNPRIIVAGVIIIAFILFYPSSRSSSIDVLPHAEDIVAYERAALRTLKVSGPQDFVPLHISDEKWLNLTGLRKEDGYAWTLLQTAKDAARLDVGRLTGRRGMELLDNVSNDSLPLYQNVTGWVRGQWLPRHQLEDFHPPLINLSLVAPNVTYSDTWERNITGAGGKVQLKLKEKNEDDDNGGYVKSSMTYVSARLTVQDDRSHGDGWEMVLYGVHHKASGHCVLTTTSEKFVFVYSALGTEC